MVSSALKQGQLRNSKVTGKSAAADNEAAEKFPKELTKIIIAGGYSYKYLTSIYYWKNF